MTRPRVRWPANDARAGDLVKAGQPLFSIDARNYRATLAQDEAMVAAAAASIGSIEQNLVLQRDVIDQARANLESAQAERTRAALDRHRYTDLVRESVASRQRFETSAADAEKADASLAAARAALASARQQSEVLIAQREEARAKLEQAKATLEGARVDLDKTVVKVPIDGAILKVDVRLGEYAQAGVLPNPLMTMGSINPLHVRVDIDASAIVGERHTKMEAQTAAMPAPRRHIVDNLPEGAIGICQAIYLVK